MVQVVEGARAVGQRALLHPGEVAERAFVLVPWSDVDPGFEVPGMGIVADLRDALPADEVAGVRPWPAEPENR